MRLQHPRTLRGQLVKSLPYLEPNNIWICPLMLALCIWTWTMEILWIFTTIAVTILTQEEGWSWDTHHLDVEFDNKFATRADLLVENTALLTGFPAYEMDHTTTSDLILSTHYWRAAKKKSGTALTENEILFFISVCFNQENILNLNLIYRDTLYTCHWSWTPCCWRDDVTPGHLTWRWSVDTQCIWHGSGGWHGPGPGHSVWSQAVIGLNLRLKIKTFEKILALAEILLQQKY